MAGSKVNARQKLDIIKLLVKNIIKKSKPTCRIEKDHSQQESHSALIMHTLNETFVPGDGTDAKSCTSH